MFNGHELIKERMEDIIKRDDLTHAQKLELLMVITRDAVLSYSKNGEKENGKESCNKIF